MALIPMVGKSRLVPVRRMGPGSGLVPVRKKLTPTKVVSMVGARVVHESPASAAYRSRSVDYPIVIPGSGFPGKYAYKGKVYTEGTAKAAGFSGLFDGGFWGAMSTIGQAQTSAVNWLLSTEPDTSKSTVSVNDALRELFPSGDYASEGYTTADVASMLQNNGYTSAALEFSVSTNQPAKLLASVAGASGATSQANLDKGTAGGDFGSLLKMLPWILGGIAALVVLPSLLRGKK